VTSTEAVRPRRSSFLSPLLQNPDARWMLRCERNGRTLATTLEPAFDSPSRRKGLLGRSSLAEGSALILAPCNSIHTWFMQFTIDVIFVRRDGSVARVCESVKPWRMRLGFGSFATIELPAGTVRRADVQRGDRVRLDV
jgi:uncharacterized protein